MTSELKEKFIIDAKAYAEERYPDDEDENERKYSLDLSVDMLKASPTHTTMAKLMRTSSTKNSSSWWKKRKTELHSLRPFKLSRFLFHNLGQTHAKACS